MTDTPRTDAMLVHLGHPASKSKFAEFARTLERENAALLADARRYRFLTSSLNGTDAEVWFHANIDACIAEMAKGEA